MKILLVHNRYQQAGGEDAVFWAEYQLLSSYGHQVEYILYDNTTIGTLSKKIKAALYIIYNPDSADLAQNKINRFHPDIIHVHNFLPLVSPSIFFVARRNRIPVVLTLHNYRLLCPSAILFYQGQLYEKSLRTIFPWDAIWKGVYRKSKVQTALVALMTAAHNLIGTWRNKVDVYITLTQFAKTKFVGSALQVPPNKFLVKPNFIEEQINEFFEREDFFLFVGRLTEEKGIRTMLKASLIYNFKLVVVGEGPLSKEVEKFAKNNANISYTGLLPKEAVMKQLIKCRALIFPSTWYEGFPMTILEAFSVGTPVLASALGGMKEIIQHNINGLLFIAGNEFDLATKVMELTEHPETLKRLSDNARDSYLKLYTPDKNYHQLMSIYKRAINEHLPTIGSHQPHKV
jgi:glycosyltransferase involved in cell wall biosynthesis